MSYSNAPPVDPQGLAGAPSPARQRSSGSGRRSVVRYSARSDQLGARLRRADVTEQCFASWHGSGVARPRRCSTCRRTYHAGLSPLPPSTDSPRLQSLTIAADAEEQRCLKAGRWAAQYAWRNHRSAGSYCCSSNYTIPRSRAARATPATGAARARFFLRHVGEPQRRHRTAVCTRKGIMASAATASSKQLIRFGPMFGRERDQALGVQRL